jgi:hypothetical protein
MPKQLLHTTNIVAVFKQACSKGMPEGMRADRFINLCIPGGFPYGALQDTFIEMIPFDLL